MTTTPRPSLPAVVRAYVLLPHATPIMAVLAATAAFAFVARGGWPGTVDLGMLLLAMFGGQIAVGAVNELVDVELDRASKPDKPLVSGLATERGARLMAATGMLLMVLGSLRFSLAAFALCALGTGLGIAYSFWFKRTPWSWLPYVLAIPLAPIWVWTALDAVPGALLALYPVAIPGLVALQLAQSIPDIEADRSVGVRTLAVLLGEGRAGVATRLLVTLSAVMAAVLAFFVLERPLFPVLAAGLATGVMLVDVVARQDDIHRARLRMFPLVVLAVGVVGIGWALGMTGA